MILTVDEVKTHLRIEEDDEDAYIEGLIKQAQAAAENFCRSRSFLNCSIRATLPSHSTGQTAFGNRLRSTASASTLLPSMWSR